MHLTFDDATEAFRRELGEWLDANAPSAAASGERPRSTADIRAWARDWPRKPFDAGWLVPGWPPELGGRNATPTQQMIYFEAINSREMIRSANPQGLGIIAPSINDYGTPEQKERFLLPTLRAEI